MSESAKWCSQMIGKMLITKWMCVCGVRARAVFHPNAILAFIFRLPYRKWILRLSHKVKHTKNMSFFPNERTFTACYDNRRFSQRKNTWNFLFIYVIVVRRPKMTLWQKPKCWKFLSLNKFPRHSFCMMTSNEIHKHQSFLHSVIRCLSLSLVLSCWSVFLCERGSKRTAHMKATLNTILKWSC